MMLYPLVPIIAGLAILGWSVRDMRVSSFLQERGSRAAGRIVGYQETKGSAKVVVRFNDPAAGEVTATHPSTGWIASRSGEAVVVAYDPARPERARIVTGTWLSTWTRGLFMFTGGAVLLIGCVLAAFAWT